MMDRPVKSPQRFCSLRSLICLLGLCFAARAGIAGTVVLDKDFPSHLEQVAVLVQNDADEPVAGAQMSVTYRPGSRVSHTDIIGFSGADGKIDWTPATAGIATITATWTGPNLAEETASTNVSVRFQKLPIDGIIIMIVAGLILIVGSATRMYKVLKSPDFVQ